MHEFSSSSIEEVDVTSEFCAKAVTTDGIRDCGGITRTWSWSVAPICGFSKNEISDFLLIMLRDYLTSVHTMTGIQL
ncbi:hypothetical protein DD237_002534 [Peronospora effusa]|uniref:Uncharacterized protein n=1 Tax=Peronospora effusa TaxID=542832 RepID=A0A3R7YCC7_9STRA|nr:hypothetical protein DD237_002534 [Peronospora effusa]